MSVSDAEPAWHDDLPVAALWPFLGLSFGIAWGAFALFLLAGDTLARLFGPVSASNPLFIVAVYAPALAALVLVLAHGGTAGGTAFLSRLLLLRVPGSGWALLLLGIPAIYFAAAMLKGTAGGWAWPFTSWGAALSAMGFMLILGPMEEFGWRGVALPLLQRRMAPIWAALVLGLIWGVWHLPAFLLSGTPQSAWSFTPFLVGSVAVSVILTPFFNASGGSLLWAILFHFQLNNPLWPDGQPHDTLIFVTVALGVTWAFRKDMFRRGAGVNRVLPERQGEGQ